MSNDSSEEIVEAGQSGSEAMDETRFSVAETAAEEVGPASDPQEWVGQKLGKYQITALLGVGGMGAVLKARDPSIERDVAIKVLHSNVAADQNVLGRFLAEAKSAGKLSHPNAVTIYEVAQDKATHYLVMENVSGGSVDEYLKSKGALSIAEATQMVIDACKGLDAAHHAGLVHRDIKPANLMLTENGTVKVGDFGLAKRHNAHTMQMTQEGQIIGTPYFMSPEQCNAKPVDARSDLYSLGATYYSMLTGENPYQDRGSMMQVMFAHCTDPPPDPREIRQNVPDACAHIIERAMAIEPEDRYQSAEAMQTDLEAVLAAISGHRIQLPSDSGAALSSKGSAEQKHPGDSKTTAAPTNRRTLLATLIGGAVFALIASALFVLWGDGGSDVTGNGNNASQPVVPPSGEPVRIGILHSLSGTMAASESAVVDATQLAIEELNKNGGVMGRPVKAVVADGCSDSAIFAREARRLIEDEGVCTVFGCWTSASRKTVVPIFEELDHLLVYPVQYEGVEESPNVIYTGAAPNQQIIPAVKWAYAFENKRKFFLVGSDYVFPRVAHEIIKDQLDVLGAEVVGDEFLPLGSNDVEPVIEKITAANPDVILNCINGDTNIAFFTSLRSAGITPEKIPTISFSIGEQELSRMDLSAMTGDYAAWNYFQSITTAENTAFVDAFHSKYGLDRVVDDPMEAAWFGVQLWAQAVNEIKTTDPQAIRRAMLNQRIVAPNGQVRIDPATQHTFKTPRIGQVQSDGSFEIVWTATKPEPPVPYPSTRTTEQWKALLHDLYTKWGNRWSAN